MSILPEPMGAVGVRFSVRPTTSVNSPRPKQVPGIGGDFPSVFDVNEIMDPLVV